MGYHPLENYAEKRTLIAMKYRCYNAKCPMYPYYGGRGIKICDRWLYGEAGESGFQCFIEDMGPRPCGGIHDRYSIDRIDGNGNYEPQNCRWITIRENTKNRPRTHKKRGFNVIA